MEKLTLSRTFFAQARRISSQSASGAIRLTLAIRAFDYELIKG